MAPHGHARTFREVGLRSILKDGKPMPSGKVTYTGHFGGMPV
jgi:hypothetical protein